jgi:transglutaminase-like putative cysteine protease
MPASNPFTYSSEEMPTCCVRSSASTSIRCARSTHGRAGSSTPTGHTDTLALLSNMTATIKHEFTYVPRPEKGTQTPIETLARRKGTCRDYAMLMIEAVRALGFAARFVSGYVYNPTVADHRTGGGNTHAWVRVYLPGSGWVEFDPTNGIVGNRGLIRVAVTRDIYQAVPISGTWSGFPGSFLDMSVGVDIDVQQPTSPIPSTADTSPRKSQTC